MRAGPPRRRADGALDDGRARVRRVLRRARGAVMSAPRERWVRGGLVALSTIAITALALVWPALARGDAWWTAKWTAWPGPLAPHPSTADAIGWLARAGWCVVLAAGVAAVPYVIWRMTLGSDARV